MAPVPAALSFSGFSTNRVRGPGAAVAGTCSVKWRIPRPSGSRLMTVMSGAGRSADREGEGRIESAHGKHAQVRRAVPGSRPLNDHGTPAQHAGGCRHRIGSDRGDVQTHVSRRARSAIGAEFHDDDVISRARWRARRQGNRFPARSPAPARRMPAYWRASRRDSAVARQDFPRTAGPPRRAT